MIASDYCYFAAIEIQDVYGISDTGVTVFQGKTISNNWAPFVIACYYKAKFIMVQKNYSLKVIRS